MNTTRRGFFARMAGLAAVGVIVLLWASLVAAAVIEVRVGLGFWESLVAVGVGLVATLCLVWGALEVLG